MPAGDEVFRCILFQGDFDEKNIFCNVDGSF